MPAPNFLTWDGDDDNLPRRPSTDDCGGDQKQDDADLPPDDVEHFTGAGWNQKAKQIPAISRVTPAAIIEVAFSGGTPAVVGYASPRSDVTSATFTPTDNGVGDTTIVWPADTFPPAPIKPTGLTLISSAGAVVDGHVEMVTNGIRVRTRSGGSAADVGWTIQIWGQ